MPVIERVRLRNFRSVDNNILSLDMGRRITIFIGPNNTGKSNILRAIELLLKTPFELFGQGKTNAELDDFHDRKHEEPTIEDIEKLVTESQQQQVQEDRMSGNIEIAYSATVADREKFVSHTLEKQFSFLRYDKDRTKLPTIESLLKEIFDIYLEEGFIAIGSLATDEDKPVLRRSGTGPRWLPIDKKRVGRINSKLRELNELLTWSISDGQILASIVTLLYPQTGQLSEDLIPSEPEYPKGFKDLRGVKPDATNVRNFLWMMREDEQKPGTTETAFTSLVDIICELFPDIDEIEPGINPETNRVRVNLVKRGEAFELGCQGDGLKRILMLLVHLANYSGNVLVLDEPERHLHSQIEERLLDYFLKYGQGQLVVATHSEAIVNSISGEALESGDVVVYSLGLDEVNRTVAKRVNESNMVDVIGNLGVPVTRYVKHMAALSRTLIFVEGPSDRRAIEKILEKHGKLKDFRKYRPFFIPVRGIRSLWKLSAELIDGVAKGDDSIKTRTVPHLIISDRDETEREEKTNDVILSVREIENTVLSLNAIRAMVDEYMAELEITPSDESQRVFEECLIEEIEQYLPRLTLLRLWGPLAREIGPLTWSESIGHPSKDEARRSLLDRVGNMQAVFSSIQDKYNEDYFDQEYEGLRILCFPAKGAPDYEYILANIPGKDFIRLILRSAFVKTASKLVGGVEYLEFNQEKARSLAGQIASFDKLVEMSEQLHPDIQRILKKLKDIHNT